MNRLSPKLFIWMFLCSSADKQSQSIQFFFIAKQIKLTNSRKRNNYQKRYEIWLPSQNARNTVILPYLWLQMFKLVMCAMLADKYPMSVWVALLYLLVGINKGQIYHCYYQIFHCHYQKYNWSDISLTLLDIFLSLSDISLSLSDMRLSLSDI